MAASATAASSARRAVGAVAAVANRAVTEPGRRTAEGRTTPTRAGTADAAPAAPTRPYLRAVGPEERLPRARRVRTVRQRRALIFVTAGFVLTMGVLANLTIHVQATQGQFELDRLESQATAREVAYQKLRVEVARLEAPQRIVAEAKRLGMTEPPEVRYLAPNGSTSVEDPIGEDGTARPDERAATGGAQAWGQVKSQLGGRP